MKVNYGGTNFMTRLPLAALPFLLMNPAWASVLYSSGAINGTIRGDSFYTPPWSLSQPFTITSSSTVTNLSNMGIWVIAADTFTSLDWMISTSPDGGGTVEASAAGVAPSSSTQLTPASDYGNSGQYDVYNVSFSVPDVHLAAGTYYLTLSNGLTSCDPGCSGTAAASPYWDENGSSGGVAYFGGSPDITGLGWSFAVDGSTGSSVPEPGPIMLLGTGLTAVGVRKNIRSKSPLSEPQERAT